MSSKLKVKKKTRFPVQTSNQAAQASYAELSEPD